MTIAENFPIIDPSLLLDFANTKALDPRITFTRASTAVYYDGVTTAKAEENLLTYSANFDNAAWIAVATTVTANTTAAPDGTTTADTVAFAGGSASCRVTRTVTAFALDTTRSVFVKAGTASFVQLLSGGDVTAFANFDVSAGTVGTVGSGVSASIVSFGGGWYRLVMTFTKSGATEFRVQGVDSASAAYGANMTTGGTVFLWGAQLEQRSSVTAYTPTTTQAITNYIPVLKTAASGEARFDHNPITGESLGLLIEESRTNLVTYSEQFDNAAWSKSNSTITANTIVSPDGTLDADKLVEDATTGAHTVSASLSATAQAYTFSIYAKKAERKFIQVFGRRDGSNYNGVSVDLDTGATSVPTRSGTTSNVSTTVVSDVGNGWWRIAMTYTYTTTGTTIVFVATGDATNTYNYTGDGYSGIFIWGAQLEAGSFATSYIPTVASQVTRAGDLATMTGTNFSSWFNYNESTFYAEAATNAVPANFYHYICSLSLGTSTSAGDFLRMSYAASKVDINIGNTGLYTTMNTATMPTYTLGVAQKQVVALASNDIAASVNGISPVTTTARTRVANVDTFTIGAQAGSSTNRSTNGTIKKLAYYPKRLTNAQLQALTA